MSRLTPFVAPILLIIFLAAGQAQEKSSADKKQRADGKPDSTPASKAKVEKKKGKSALDDELFGDLTGDLFEGLDRPKLADPPKPAGKEKQKQPEKTKSPTDDPLTGQLGQGEDLGQESDPFLELGQRIRRVEQLLAEAKTGDGTQKMQDEIIRDLQKMIEIARQCECNGQSSSSSRKGSKSQSKISTAGKKGGDGNAQPSSRPTGSDTKVREAKVTKPKLDNSAMASDKHVWGLLPKHLQDAIMGATSDKVLDEYDQEVKEYFTRLAELFQQNNK
jgi:hypothetical protein